MKSRGILKFDWMRATLLFGGGLHYGQESFNLVESIGHGWKNDMGANVASPFLKGSSAEVKFLGQAQSLRQET